jgi:phosphatidylinositol alpha-1,6-mannosyltransferase
MKLVFSQVFPPEKGGSGRWLYEAYSRMPERSFVMLVGTSPAKQSTDGNFPQEIVRADLRINDRSFFSFGSFCAYLKMIWLLFKTVRRYQVTEIHAARPLFEGLATAIISYVIPIRFVQFVHGEDVNIATTSRKLGWVTAFTLKRAELIITNSNFSRGLLLKDWQVPISRIKVVHPGVDLTYFKPGDSIKEVDKTFTILTVGRLQKRKGHDMLIRAIAEIGATSPVIRYRIAGEGEEKTNLEHLATELGFRDQVDFLGEICDSALLLEYQKCDLFVLPNRAVGKDVEGFGIVLLEAQACGKPVIAGSSGGTIDALDHGKSGFAISCENTDDLVKYISSFVFDSEMRERMAKHAVEFTNKRFSWETSFANLLAALNSF